MKRPRRCAVLLALAPLLAGCGVVGDRNAEQRREGDRRELRAIESREALAASERRVADLQTQLQEARARLAAAESEVARRPAAPAPQPTPTPSLEDEAAGTRPASVTVSSAGGDAADPRADADALRAQVRDLTTVLQAREEQVAALRAELDGRRPAAAVSPE